MARRKVKARRKVLLKKFRKLSGVQIGLLLTLATAMGFLVWNIFASTTGPFSTRFTVFGNNTGAPQCGIPAKEGYTVAFDVDKITADVKLPPANRQYCGKYIHVASGLYAGRYMQIVDGCGACRASYPGNGGSSFARIDVYCNYPESAKDFYSVCAARGVHDNSPNTSTTYLTSSATSSPGTPTGPNPTFAYCATENGSCSLSGYHDIAFGGNGHYLYKNSFNGSTTCSNASFGSDPLPGVVKACWAFHLPSAYRICASENNFCAFNGIATVVYGAIGKYNTKGEIWGPSYDIAGDRGVWCNNGTFGDPTGAYGSYGKHCYYEPLSQANFACSSHPTVGYGYTTTGTCVRRVQYILRKTAPYESNSGEDPGVINGTFGTSTYNAVRNFQSHHYQAGTNIPLSIDGVAGPNTWGALEGQCTYINQHNRYGITC